MGWLPALLVGLTTGYAAISQAGLTDLSVYLGGVASPSLYDFSRGAAPFTYPPFAALLFGPLTHVPLVAIQIAWTVATVGVVVAIARLFPSAPSAALLLMLSAPVSSDLRYGQVSLFLAGLVLIDRRGVLIGVAAAVKLTPLIFIPMLWSGGRRREAVTATATFAACGAAAWVVRPADSLRYWTEELRDVDRLGHIAGVGNQSLNGALLRLGLASDVRAVAVLLLGGPVVLLALRRAARLAKAGDRLAATIVTGAASVVLSPVSWTHHQIWLVLAALLPAHRAWRWTAVVVMLLPVTALGPPLWSNGRLLLAVAVAALIPFRARLLPPVPGPGPSAPGARPTSTGPPAPAPAKVSRRTSR